MTKEPEHALSRRERQIMDAIYARGEATAEEVREALPDPPSNSAVRALLRILEQKGHLRHVSDGIRHVYKSTRARHKAARSAIRRLVRTFFKGSAEKAVAALLEASDGKLSDEELDRLAERIDQARERGR